MRNIVINTIKKYDLINRGDRIVIALSGGADSMALLFFLRKEAEKLGISLFGVHINHMIRGKEADSDCHFVSDYCKSANIKLLTLNKNVPEISKLNKLSIEEAGRLSRKEAYEAALEAFGADKIATGHNKNDQAETLLFRLARGSGPKGLGGISPKNGNIIRPLIDATREEIEAYCKENTVPFVMDSTNKQEIYTRNKIRLSLIPWLRQNLNPDIIDTLSATSEIMREQTEFIEKAAASAYTNSISEESSDEIKFSVRKLNENDISIRKLIVRQAVSNISEHKLKNISSSHIDDILGLTKKGTGKRLSLPNNLICKIEYGHIIFTKKNKKSTFFNYKLKENGMIYIKERNFYVSLNYDTPLKNDKFKNLCTKTFKCDRIFVDVCIRTRLPHDVIKLKGGTKKLKSFFIDKKIPRETRNSACLIAADNNILSVLNVVDSEEVKSGEKIIFIQFWED